MNKIKKLIGIIMCALVLTGCELKYEGKVEITEDGKMDMSVIMAYDRELVSNLIYMEKNSDNLLGNGNTNPDETDVPEASITEIRKYLEDNKPEEQDGLEVSRYERNGYYGYQMSYEIENIDEVSSKDDIESSLFDGFDIQDDDTSNNNKDKKQMMFKKDGDTYYAKYKINEDSNSSMNTSMLDVNLEYTVTLPTKPIKHNADTVSEDGKTLTWQIDGLDNTKENIEYSFKLKDTVATAANGSGLNTEMIMLIAGIVIIVIIIVVVLVLFARNNKKLDKSLEALDQTIPSGVPKPSTPVIENPVVENNVVSTPAPTTQTPNEPVVKAETQTVEPVVTSPVENIVEPQNTNTVSRIETVPVVENIPVTNTENLEQNNIAPTETQVEEKVTPVEPTTPNIEEMPIIMEPSVVTPVQSNTIPEAQTNTTSEVVNPVVSQETVSAFEQEGQITPENITETIETSSETPVINEEPIVTNVEEPTVIETPSQVETPAQVAEPVIEKTQEPISTPVPESNIFDTPNMPDTSVQTLETIPVPETSVAEIKNEVPTIETITPEPVVENVVEQPNIIETPLMAETTIQEVNTESNIETININDTPTVEPEPVIPVEPNKVGVEENIEPLVENVITTETIDTVNPVTTEHTTTEEPKLEVLENTNTLEEPDIPLPEPVVEEPISSVQTLEEAPVIEEPTGNRFIQTDFIENRKEETDENNTNL